MRSLAVFGRAIGNHESCEASPQCPESTKPTGASEGQCVRNAHPHRTGSFPQPAASAPWYRSNGWATPSGRKGRKTGRQPATRGARRASRSLHLAALERFFSICKLEKTGNQRPIIWGDGRCSIYTARGTQPRAWARAPWRKQGDTSLQGPRARNARASLRFFLRRVLGTWHFVPQTRSQPQGGSAGLFSSL